MPGLHCHRRAAASMMASWTSACAARHSSICMSRNHDSKERRRDSCILSSNAPTNRAQPIFITLDMGGSLEPKLHMWKRERERERER